jgi:lipid-binding SYLF domain-containing protein
MGENVMHRRILLLAAILVTGLISGCSSTPQNAAESEAKKTQINAGVDATLARLYKEVPGSQQLAQKASGILVFPDVVKGAAIVGGEYGEGALRVGGQTVGYYSTAAASFGLSLGAASKAVVFMFMNKQALDDFRNSSGWEAGATGAVVALKSGAAGQIDTATASAPVVGAVLTNSGLLVDASLNGTKVSKLNL